MNMKKLFFKTKYDADEKGLFGGYGGTYVPLDFYEQDDRVLSVMLECRADQFLDEKLQPHAGLTKVASALALLISKAKI